MDQRRFSSQSWIILVAMLLSSACAASPDTLYKVSGTFGTSATYTGPLNGGTFSGTFAGPLPIAITGVCCTETITAIEIQLISPFGVTLATLSGPDSSGNAYFTVSTGPTCVVSASLAPGRAICLPSAGESASLLHFYS